MVLLPLCFALSIAPLAGAPPARPQDAAPSRAAAQQQEQQQEQQQPPQAAGGQSANSAARNAESTSGLLDVVSIDRIRKELERAPALTFTMPDPNVARYRLEVQENRFKGPDFLADFVVPTSPVSQPLGGSDYYEMMRLNTPPQYWGSAPFTNGDLLKMSALTGAYGLVGALVRKGMEARQSAAAARAHQEVQEELAALAELNAKAAAVQAGADAKKKPPDPKKKKDPDKQEPK